MSTYETKLGRDFLILHLICFVHCDNIFFVFKYMVMFSKNWLSSLFSMIENGSVVVTHARLCSRQCRKMTHAQCEGLLSPKGLPSCSDRVNGRGLGRFSFRPKSPQKGRGHLKHDFRL